MVRPYCYKSSIFQNLQKKKSGGTLYKIFATSPALKYFCVLFLISNSRTGTLAVAPSQSSGIISRTNHTKVCIKNPILKVSQCANLDVSHMI